MFTNRIQWIASIAVLAWCVAPAHGSALTYAFSGTLWQPYNGSTQFSGTFTYDTDLPPYPGSNAYPGSAAYSGVPYDPTEPPVSLTFTLGNTPSSSFGTVSSDEVLVDHNLGGSPQGGDLFGITQQYNEIGGVTAFAKIGFGNDDLIQSAPFSSTAPPSSLSLAAFSMGGNLVIEFVSQQDQVPSVFGTITSLTLISSSQTPVPEPSSLLIFAGLAAAICAHRRVNRKPRQR
jgi:hypothetical protein